MKQVKVAAALKIKTYPETCSIHKTCHLMGFGDKEPICPKCEQEKIEREKVAKVEKFKENSVRAILRRKSLVDDKDTFKCSFESYSAKNETIEAQIKQKARSIAGEYYLHPEKKFNSVLYGTPGTGKTHLSMSILKAVNENANPAQKCLFINVETLFSKIKSSFENSSSWWTVDNVLELVKSVDLLVLDDLGTEAAMRSQGDEASNFVQETLKEILDKQRRVIITTNLDSDQLNRVYNPKVVSRILRGSAGHVIDFSQVKDKRVLGF
ncbi:DnaA ATPase domain-containing protein [Lactobacillus johnsonii]|uniref:DnaA ATPase domain-containing protein n=1 Tax=Lactobacillus johnsonii TaxID=33959 RepID=UPI00107EC4E8|nr:DnaA/Hda family protein [Lactobacillus johnsonii]TGA94994.1 AAA family ATPase [Lactobacillus johnsonii]